MVDIKKDIMLSSYGSSIILKDYFWEEQVKLVVGDQNDYYSKFYFESCNSHDRSYHLDVCVKPISVYAIGNRT